MQKKLKLITIFLFIILALPLFFFQSQPQAYAFEPCTTDADCDEGWECGEDNICELVVKEKKEEKKETEGFELQVNIPGLTNINPQEGTSAIGEYIKAIYNYAIGIVGILAALVIMLGGVIWLTAGGNTGRIDNAKSWITAGLTGLVIALSSYAILYTINPDLVDLQTTKPGGIPTYETGCCDTGNNCQAIIMENQNDCEGEYFPNKICKAGRCVSSRLLPNGTKCARSKKDNPESLPLCANCKNGYHSEGDENFCGPSSSEEADPEEIGCCITDFNAEDGCEAGIPKSECDGAFELGEDKECKDTVWIGINWECQ